MKLMYLLAILAHLNNIILACPLPFNNVKFIDSNDTYTIVEEIMLENSLGWADAVSKLGNRQKRWPRQQGPGDKYTVIRYCYKTLNDKLNFEDWINEGIELWTNALRAPGASSGHSLKFEEVEHSGVLEMCQVYDSILKMTMWNPAVPKDAVTIQGSENKNIVGSGHLGYMDEATNPAAGRHYFTLNAANLIKDPRSPPAHTVAHEIGHILGLWHEHQRADRDHYVKFQCEKLKRYDEVKAEVLKRGLHTMQEACEDQAVAYLYGFEASQYSKKSYVEFGDMEWRVEYGIEYDLKSIMHYNSFQSANTKMTEIKTSNFPLIEWVDGNSNFDPPQGPVKDEKKVRLISSGQGPSLLDVARVKQLYPWND